MAAGDKKEQTDMFDFADELPMVVDAKDLHGKRIWILTVELKESQNGIWYEVQCAHESNGQKFQVNANMKTWFGKTADRIVTDQIDLPLCFDVKPYGKYTRLEYVGNGK